MKRIVFSLLAIATAVFAADDDDDISGFWRKYTDDGKPEAIFAIYEYDGLYYGRLVASYDDSGEKIDDTIYAPKKRAPGVVGDPFYSGLDIIYDLADAGSRYKGKIVDPKRGNVYNSEVWREGKDLMVRGKLAFFGQTLHWYPFPDADFPSNFKKPNLKKFVPNIPEVK